MSEAREPEGAAPVSSPEEQMLPAARFVSRLQAEALGAQATFLPFRPGVELATLYRDDVSGAHCALLRYAPGARVPPHRHDGYEQIVVLEGEQCDELGSYTAGTFIINPPGSQHEVWSPEGCLVLIIWQRPVTFLTIP